MPTEELYRTELGNGRLVSTQRYTAGIYTGGRAAMTWDPGNHHCTEHGFGVALADGTSACPDCLRAEVAALREERDQAIAHDRQPYPTAWAYEQACKALENTKRELAEARALLADMLAAYVHFDHDEPTGAAARARAFLRGDECECPVEGHNPGCERDPLVRARDEARRCMCVAGQSARPTYHTENCPVRKGDE